MAMIGTGAYSRSAPGLKSGLKPALRKGIALLGLGLLAACSSANTAEDADIWDDVLAAGRATFGLETTLPSQAPDLSRAMLAGFGQPLIRLTNLREGSSATMIPASQRGPTSDRIITWRGVDTVTFTTRNDLMIMTRGIGGDLMSSDLRGLDRALRAGGGSYGRSHVVLLGNTEAQTLSFACTLRATGSETVTIVERSHATTRFSEECAGPAGTFRNAYWRGTGDGTLWLSRQWLGPGLGHLQVERVIK